MSQIVTSCPACRRSLRVEVDDAIVALGPASWSVRGTCPACGATSMITLKGDAVLVVHPDTLEAIATDRVLTEAEREDMRRAIHRRYRVPL